MDSPHLDEGEIPETSSTQNSRAASRLHPQERLVDSHDRTRHGKHNSGESMKRPRRHGANSAISRNSRSPDGGPENASSLRHYRPRRSSPEPRMSRRDSDRDGRAHRDERDYYSYRGPQSSYIDLDRPSNGADPDGGYGSYRGGRDNSSRDWDRQDDYRSSRDYPDRRFRRRSRSPPSRDRDGLSRRDQAQPTYGHRDSHSKQDGARRGGNAPPSAKADAPNKAASAGQVISRDAKQSEGSMRDSNAMEVDSPSVLAATSLQPNPPVVEEEEPQIVDMEKEIARRRRRREAILAKSTTTTTPLLVQALHGPDSTAAPSTREPTQTPDAPSPSAGDSPSATTPRDADSPMAFDLQPSRQAKDSNDAGEQEDGPSAADYDPTADMQEDGRRDEMRQGHIALHGQTDESDAVGDKPVADTTTTTANTATAAATKSADDDDADDFDMFAEDFDDDKYMAGNPAQAKQQAAAAANAPADGAILEGDDKEGYYKIRPGEMLDGRYQLQAALGKGMFSGVAQAVDVTTNKLVAIKMMRNNDALRKGGLTEIAILQKLNSADPDDRKHIVRFQRHFDFKGHLCLSFEHLSMNLREVLRKFGNNVGINLVATRSYAQQIFIALAHMRRHNIIHADLKPDNILVNEKRNVVKLCDLGTAIDRSDAATAQDAVTPYLVSRFYRAPELILGMPYDYGVDMWSVGCTLYELYTGKILFTGNSNNQMLKAIMETRGRIMPKLYKKGHLSGMHFDDMGRFLSAEVDKFGKVIVRTLPMTKPTRDLRTRLMVSCAGGPESEAKDAGLFLDLLEQCLAINPDKRIHPMDALKHPFFGPKASAR